MEQQLATQQQAPQQSQGQPGQPPQGRGGQALHRIVVAAMKIVYGPKMAPQLVEMMGNGEPAEAVAQATLAVLDGLKQKMKGINPNFAYAASSMVAGMLFEIGEAAGLFKFEQPMLQQAMQIMAQQLQGDSQQSEQGAPPAAQSPQQQPTPRRGLIQMAMGA